MDPGTASRTAWYRRPWVIGTTITLVVALAAVVLLVFEPQAAFIDERVDEDFPVVTAAPTPAAGDAEPDPEAPVAAQPETLGSGDFTSLNSYSVSGQASIVRVEGQTFLRFEDLDSSNGPDLRVYLSTADASDPDALTDDFVSLGTLKGNQGNQTYELPADVDPARFRSVTIWCERFSVGFGVAPLVA